jgi:hypothetical protein
MESIQRFVQKNELFILAAFVFFVFYFLAVLKPTGIFWSLDEGGKWIYMENVLRTGNPRAPLIYPGQSLDSDLESVALYYYARTGRHLFTWWPVGLSLITLPFYRVMGWAGLFLLPALAGAIIVYFSGKITETLSHHSKNTVRVIAIIVAFATPVAFYSTTFWEHTLSVACVLITLYCLLVSMERTTHVALVVGGVAGSLATFFRLESGLIILGMGLTFFIFEWKRAIPFAISGLVTTSAWVVGNMWITGHPFSSSMESIQAGSSFIALKSVGLRFVSYALFNSPTIGAFDLGDKLLFFATLLAVMGFILGLYRRTIMLSVIASAGVTAICGYVLLQPSLYRSVHGFVLISPFVLMSSWVIGAQAWRANKKFWTICGVGVFVFMVGYIMRAWVSAGGLQWGPRYMLALYPIMVIAGVVGIQKIVLQVSARQKTLVLAAASLAVLVGIGFETRGYITMYLTMDLYEKSAATLRTLKNQVIKTECTWMPMVIPDLYWNGNIFTNTDSEMWVKNVRKRGLDSYLFVKMYSCDTDPIDQEIRQYSKVKDGLDIKEVFFNP